MCPICFNIFEDLPTLPCSYTFDRSCLGNVLQASGHFYELRPLRIPLKCPSCRSATEIGPTGIQSLPVDFASRASIEMYQQQDIPEGVFCPEHYKKPLNVLLEKKLFVVTAL